MAAVLEKLAAVKDDGDELWSPAKEFVATETDIENPAPEPAAPATPETVPIPATSPEPAPVPKHSALDIQRALAIAIPAAEIDDMTPKELHRILAHADRINRSVAPAPAAETPKPASDDIELDFGTDESGVKIDPKDVDPGLVNAVKSAVKAVKQQFEQKFQTTEQKSRDEAVKAIHSRVYGEVIGLSDDVAKGFDRTTAKGQQNFERLLYRMGGILNESKAMGLNYTEKQIIEEAIRSMGLTQVKPAEPTEGEKKLAAKKDLWDKAALGTPKSPKGGTGLDEVVTRVLRESRAEEDEKVTKTQWLD